MTQLFLDGSKLLHHIPRVSDWIEKKEIFPIHVEISPSSGCNQRCILCCVDYKKHKPGFLNRNVLLSLADDFAKYGVKSYLLAGEGEPLLNKHVPEFVQKCFSLGVDGALNSNAVLMNKDIAEKVLPCLTWARFTVQSPYSADYGYVHGTNSKDYKLALKNIEHAVHIKKKLKLDVTIGIQQILINENYDQVYDNAVLAKKLGVDYFTVKRFSKHPENSYDVPEDLYKKSKEQFEKCDSLTDDSFSSIVRWNQFEGQCIRNYKKCIGLPFITQVLADGSISPCCMFFDDKSSNYGNLNEHSFSEIWLSDNKKKIMKYIENNVNVQNCMTYCRHHSTNIFLWQFMEKPSHINFI